MKKVICILSDALRHDYVDRHKMSFLQEVIANGRCFYAKRILPSTGFCEISEYVLGKDSIENRMLTQITARPQWPSARRNRKLDYIGILQNNVIFHRIDAFKRSWSLLSKKLVDPYLNRVLSPELVRVRYNIPLGLLPFMRATESVFEYDSFDFGAEDNIFVQFQRRGISYDIEDFVRHNKVRGSDKDRLKSLSDKITKRDLADFTLIYIGYCEQAHHLGTNSKRFTTVLQEYSAQIKAIAHLLAEHYSDWQLVIVGDHGMADVDNYINVASIIKKVAKSASICFPNDYIYFIDSTLVRIWLRSKHLIRDFEMELKGALDGYIEQRAGILQYLDRFKTEYGDIIILLKLGNVFYPDFFNLVQVKGMHGYFNGHDEMYGTLISIGNLDSPGGRDQMKLSQVKNYLLSLLE